MSTNANVEPFSVKDCALVTIATGKKAQNLKEMREHLLNIHLGSVYHHFWGGLLRPRFDEPEYTILPNGLIMPFKTISLRNDYLLSTPILL